jgi:perosamine synthetase
LKHQLLQIIRDVVHAENIPLHLHEPSFDQEDKDALMACIDSGFVSSVGQFVNQFEDEIKVYTGAAGAVSCVNGTAALHLCLIAAGVKKDDEVLLPSLTFAATANACIYNSSVPHFVEVSSENLSVDPLKLREHLCKVSEQKNNICYNKSTGRRISALIVMHCFGHIGDFDSLNDICNEFNIELIEDAAESLGSLYKNRQSGSLAKYAAISFNGNKIITTGGGGIFLTSDESIAKNIKHISTTAKVPHPYAFIHDQVGFNYRMPNLNAALGVAQLKKLPQYLNKKRELASLYKQAFNGSEIASFIAEPNECKSNYWLNSILLKDSDKIDEIITFLHKQNIFVRPIWTPLHKLEHFSGCPRADLSETLELEKTIICLPSSSFLI